MILLARLRLGFKERSKKKKPKPTESTGFEENKLVFGGTKPVSKGTHPIFAGPHMVYRKSDPTDSICFVENRSVFASVLNRDCDVEPGPQGMSRLEQGSQIRKICWNLADLILTDF
jgi:hypothetical protein